MNLKRKIPLTPTKASSPTKAQIFRQTSVESSNTSGVDGQPTECQTSGSAPNHFRVQLSPDLGEKMNAGKQSFKGNVPLKTETARHSGDVKLRNLSPCQFTSAENKQTFNSLHKKFSSEGDIFATSSSASSLDKGWTTSTLDLRDSGFQDRSANGSQSSLDSRQTSLDYPSTFVRLRRRSVSTDSSASQAKLGKSSSVPVLAVHALRATLPRDGEEEKPNINAATLKSYKSMELLTSDDVEAIQTNLAMNLEQLNSCETATFPEIPKRISSNMENCTVTDEYLMNQGKRLSQVLNLNRVTKKHEKNHFRNLMSKIAGTLQLKKNKSVCSLPTTPQMPQCKLPSTLTYPSGPPPPTAPRPDNSPTDSCYIPVSSISVPNSPCGSAAQLGKSTGGSGATGGGAVPRKTPEYLQILSPSTPSPKDRQLTYENNEIGGNSQTYYQVPPPQKVDADSLLYENTEFNGTPSESFYQVPPPSPRGSVRPPSYENKELDESTQSFYQVPPSPVAVGEAPPFTRDVAAHETESSIYENKSIECGSKNEITFNNSRLHIYSTPKSSLAAMAGEVTPTTSDGDHLATGGVRRALSYENNEIQPSSKDGISTGGEELHVYQVPPTHVVPSPANKSIPPPPPPPPVRPPKPLPALPPKQPQSGDVVKGGIPRLPPKPFKADNASLPLPPKPLKTDDAIASSPVPPKRSAQSPASPSINISSGGVKSLKKHIKDNTSTSGKLKAPATAPKPLNKAAIYYEDVSDWLAVRKDEEYSKLNREFPLPTRPVMKMLKSNSFGKDGSSNTAALAPSTSERQSEKMLYTTSSEPDLRESIYYENMDDDGDQDKMEEDNMYVAMASAGSIKRHSSMEDLKQCALKTNSKGQAAPKCPPKPRALPPLPKRSITWTTSMMSSPSVGISNVRDKVALMSQGEGGHSGQPHSSRSTRTLPATPQSSPPQMSTPLEGRQSRQPWSTRTLPSTPQSSPPQMSTPLEGRQRSQPWSTRTLPSTPQSSPAQMSSPPEARQSRQPWSTRTLPSTPQSSPPQMSSPPVSLVSGGNSRPVRPNKLPILPPPMKRSPTASPMMHPTPHLPPPTPFAASPMAGSQSDDKKIATKKGPLPPTPSPTPPPPTPPPISTIPGAKLASPATPRTTPLIASGLPFPPTTTTFCPPKSPPPPPPPPISTIPKTTPIISHEKKFPAPPSGAPPPPPPPPPPSAPHAPPPPPPPIRFKAPSAGSSLGLPKANKLVRRPPPQCEKSPAEQLSAELFARIKGLSKRLDDEASDAYQNMQH